MTTWAEGCSAEPINTRPKAYAIQEMMMIWVSLLYSMNLNVGWSSGVVTPFGLKCRVWVSVLPHFLVCIKLITIARVLCSLNVYSQSVRHPRAASGELITGSLTLSGLCKLQINTAASLKTKCSIEFASFRLLHEDQNRTFWKITL